MVALAVPMAALPVSRAMVKVGPPLFCKGPRLSCSEVTVVAQEIEDCVVRLFAIEFTPPGPAVSPPLVLLAIMVLAMLMEPASLRMPPPVFAELPDRVELERVILEVVPALEMPPPPTQAVLPDRVELMTVRLPL